MHRDLPIVQKIADIISIMSSIAFQTNILALNARLGKPRVRVNRMVCRGGGAVNNLADRSAGRQKRSALCEELVSLSGSLWSKHRETMFNIVNLSLA